MEENVRLISAEVPSRIPHQIVKFTHVYNISSFYIFRKHRLGEKYRTPRTAHYMYRMKLLNVRNCLGDFLLFHHVMAHLPER